MRHKQPFLLFKISCYPLLYKDFGEISRDNSNFVYEICQAAKNKWVQLDGRNVV
ncbi:hypothetical protein CLOSTMETH_00368 [[Clostridium] methylpentosum DSM 5476]|uniref:Uncharacterized protein n=1 Tax=[Clostridium] methylpentosum DSM 5476 TaxID=537013 RepID=C0E971_9FIRM|nr:hypothetical protein CLOSTMETH_00368 [[Clostridium] methylpentosum DSM 5476]